MSDTRKLLNITAIREVGLKTALGEHGPSTSVAKAERPGKAQRPDTEPSVFCWAASRSTCWKIVWQFLLMLNGPSNSTPGSLPNRSECACPPKTQRNTWAGTLRAAFSLVAKHWVQPECPPQALEYVFGAFPAMPPPSATLETAVPLHASPWVNSTLGVKSRQTRGDVLCDPFSGQLENRHHYSAVVRVRVAASLRACEVLIRRRCWEVVTQCVFVCVCVYLVLHWRWHVTGTSVNIYKKEETALAGAAQWMERWPANQRVASLIPSQGTCLACRPGPQLGGHARGNHTLMFLSFSFSLPPLVSNNK